MTQKLFTKSRMKVALDCPTKLWYMERPDVYGNNSEGDSFLEALAQGGYQVGELAKLYYPGGNEVVERSYEESLRKTQELLQQKNVVIYEAAIRFQNLFVRVDILVKKGNKVQLIEVKSKSFDGDIHAYNDSVKENDAYLNDIAFQKYVALQAFPEWKISAFLMLADKSQRTEVNGLNQLFSLRKNAQGQVEVKVNHAKLQETGLGNPILTAIPVDAALERCFFNAEKFGAYEEFILNTSAAFVAGKKIESELTVQCFSCEFRNEEEGKQSGFKECWKKHKKWTEKDFAKPTIDIIWDNRRKAKFFKQEKYFLEDLTPEDLSVKNYIPIHRTDRQWMQVEKTLQGDTEPYIDMEGLRSEMQQLTYPLHFIDFETSMVAIPFYQGQHPYEQVAFQYSHHILYEDGRVEHKSQFLELEKGVFPNFRFLRALKQDLEQDQGSIFRYATHENTVLNQIKVQLLESEENIPDLEELISFIDSITNDAERSMVDLLLWVKNYYYHPSMAGSNSIKAVLPAVLKSSPYIQQKYGQAIYGKGQPIESLNFETPMVWVQKDAQGEILNPYKLLPRLFEDIDIEEAADFMIDDDALADGGAAMTAFAKMQFSEMSDREYQAVVSGLKKYCELDTLAMVIIFEYWAQESFEF
jgi:hypothetical protein